MTKKNLVIDRSMDTSLNRPADSALQKPAPAVTVPDQARLLEAMKTQYQLHQQVQFLSLQAETESLLQQLKVIQQQRQALIGAGNQS